jgi:hypothetical protein
MIERYIILNELTWKIKNIVLWDGNLETWQPAEGTIVKLESEIDYAVLEWESR